MMKTGNETQYQPQCRSMRTGNETLVADCNPLHVTWSVSTVSVKCTKKSEPFPHYKLLLQSRLASLWCRLPNLRMCPLNCLWEMWIGQHLFPHYTHLTDHCMCYIMIVKLLCLLWADECWRTHQWRRHTDLVVSILSIQALKLHMAFVSEWDGVQWYEATSWNKIP